MPRHLCSLLWAIFLLASVARAGLEEDLFADGQWAACRIECRRTELQSGPQPRLEDLLRRCEAGRIASQSGVPIAPPAADTPPAPVAWSGRPGLWLISLYRFFIRPALQNRCLLEPSCSEYACQALARHGVLGLGFVGDRLLREPDIVAAQSVPIRSGPDWRYGDPLDEHDAWLRPSPAAPCATPEATP